MASIARNVVKTLKLSICSKSYPRRFWFLVSGFWAFRFLFQRFSKRLISSCIGCTMPGFPDKFMPHGPTARLPLAEPAGIVSMVTGFGGARVDMLAGEQRSAAERKSYQTGIWRAVSERIRKRGFRLLWRGSRGRTSHKIRHHQVQKTGNVPELQKRA